MLSPKMLSGWDLQGFDVRHVTSSFCHVTMCSDAMTHGLLHPLTLRSLRSKRLEGRGPVGSRASMVRDGATRLLAMRGNSYAALATSTLRKRTSEKWPSGGIRRRSASSMPFALASHLA